MKEGVVFLYVTCSSEEEAKKIGKALLEERLCACINIYSKVKSMYWWEEKIEESEEAILIVKTKDSLSKEAESKILKLHSYSCPCVAKIKIEKTNECFFNWLLKETKEI
jgi:periplasmic divalent cation tolerance protein